MQPVSIAVEVHRNTDGDTPSGFVSDLVENPEDMFSRVYSRDPAQL